MAAELNDLVGAVIKAEELMRRRAAKEQGILRKEAMIANMEARIKESNRTSWADGPRGISGNEIEEYQEEIERLRKQIDVIRESVVGVDRELEKLEAETETIAGGQDKEVERKDGCSVERMNECRRGITAAKCRMHRDGGIVKRLEEEWQVLSREVAAGRVRHKLRSKE